MKKILFLFSLLFLILLITPFLIRADINDAFGNVRVTVPIKDQEVSQDSALDITWNTTNWLISRLVARKTQIFFRVTLFEDLDCSQINPCQPQKYELESGKFYPKSSDATYSYHLAALPAEINPPGRYRVAVCYHAYAGQRLTKILARTRCGASAAFMLTPATQPLEPLIQTDQDQYTDDYYDQSADQFYTGEETYSQDGECGAASEVASFNQPPEDDLCSIGESASLLKNNDKWSWVCRGVDGGADAQCETDVLSPSCTDSDNGKNYGQVGQVTGIDGQGQEMSEDDQCDQTDDLGKQLTENYCTVDKTMQSETYSCVNGCYQGACLPNPTQDYAAKFVSQESFPNLMTSGQTSQYTARMKNTGKKPWLGGSFFKLGSLDTSNNWGSLELITNPNNGVQKRVDRIQLSQKVNPGEDIVFSANLTATSAPGVYSLQWQMVREWNGGWFGDKTQALTVTVGQQSFKNNFLASLMMAIKNLLDF